MVWASQWWVPRFSDSPNGKEDPNSYLPSPRASLETSTKDLLIKKEKKNRGSVVVFLSSSTTRFRLRSVS